MGLKDRRVRVPAEIELEDVACPLGCVRDDRVVIVGCDQVHDIDGVFQVVRCAGCGLMRTNPRPTSSTIGHYYPASYHPYNSTTTSANVVRKRRPLWRKALAKAFESNGLRLPPRLQPGRMLELGSASGSYLHYMKSEGWEVEGIEPSASAAQSAKAAGFNVQNCQLESAQLAPNSYDLVVGWMVVEHLHDLVGGLTQLHDAAKPGGYLVISVPNAAALERHIFGQRWFALDVPRHTYHFTPSTIRNVLATAGWTVERILPHREFRNVFASLSYAARDAGLPKVSERFTAFSHSKWSYYPFYPGAAIAAAVGQTGRMTIWAQRR